MGTKNNPSKYDCHTAALPDEPTFTLLARDPQAPKLIEAWARDRRSAVDRGEREDSDMQMVAEAEIVAQEMRVWRTKNNSRWRMPTLNRFVVSISKQADKVTLDLPWANPSMAAWHAAATLVSAYPCEITVARHSNETGFELNTYEFGFVDPGNKPYLREIVKR